ncbi:MAG: hypothetical protein IT379_26030 [Deltaproteobacteria bacterium]|nr:hypothetical protein [Deltaproteobacteria bacterium]
MGALLVAVVAGCLWPAAAVAQDAGAIPSAADATAPSSDAGAPTQADAGSCSGPEGCESPDVEALYDRALDALVAGAWDDAGRLLDEVATRATTAGRRSAARDLAREARERHTAMRRTDGAPGPRRGAPDGSLDAWIPPPSTAPDSGESRAPTRVAPSREPAPAAPEPEGNGRLALVIGATIYGLAAAGPLTPLSLDVDDTKGFLGLYLLVAGGSFFLPFLLTRDADVPWGATALGLSGAVRGLAHGALLSLLLDDGSDEQTMFASMLVVSMLELGVGYLWADQTDMTAGEAHAAYLGSDVGLGLGLGLGVIAVGDDVDLERDPGVVVAGLVGAAAGVVGGRLFASARSWTWGDAELVQTTFLGGLYTGLTTMVVLGVEDVRALTSAAIVGSMGGLVIGDLLTRGRDVTTGQSIGVELGMFAGGFVGAGLGFLAFSDSDGDLDEVGARAMLGVSAATAIGGLALTYLLLDIDEERPRPRRPAGAPRGEHP